MGPSPTPPDGWFDEIAAFAGPAYWAPGTTRVQAFTTGTEQEVDFLVGALALEPGATVLDVGCGPGRHALSLARRGMQVVGLDRAPAFVALARDSAEAQGLTVEFLERDVRDLDFEDAFDAVVCLCQGGFGLLGGHHEAEVFARIAAAVRRGGGRLALSAFSAAFAVRHLEDGETFDVVTGVVHENAVVHGPGGDARDFELWTTCWTVRELEALAASAGLTGIRVSGVRPGHYGHERPTLEHPELLLLATRAV